MPGFNWENYGELNRLMANRLLERDIGSAWHEATELYLEWKGAAGVSPAEFCTATAARRERIRELANRIAAGRENHGR